MNALVNPAGIDYRMTTPSSGASLPKAGWHQGICHQVVDLGFQGSRDYAPSRQIALVFFLDDGNVIWKKYTFSAHPKSSFFKAVTNWQNVQAIDPGFDPSILLGKPAAVQIKHEQKGDRTKAKMQDPQPPLNDDWQKVVVPDYAIVAPDMPADTLAAQLPKLHSFLQDDFKKRISEAQFKEQKAAYMARKKAAEAAKSAEPDGDLA